MCVCVCVCVCVCGIRSYTNRVDSYSTFECEDGSTSDGGRPVDGWASR